MTRVTIYSKPGCHLCDDMKRLVQRVTADDDSIAVDEIDISTSADLLARYEEEIPVLSIDGRKIAKYRITEEELRRALDARLRVRD